MGRARASTTLGASRLAGHALAGVALALLSTFVGERSAAATYPDIMGCEVRCEVVATGWPLVFVRDYLGMSVGNRADITEVWFAADRFDWLPFVVDALAWALVSYVATAWAARLADRLR